MTIQKDSTKMENILFNVTEKPVFIQEEEQMKSADGFKALINDSTGEMLSIVSNKYTPVSNKEVLNHFTGLLDSNKINYKLGEAFSTRNGRKTVMELILPDHVIKVDNGDSMEMRSYLINSFDGGTGVRLQMGNFRHACMNLALVVGNKDVDFKTSHIGNVSDRVNTQFDFYVNKKFNENKTFMTDLTQGAFNNKQNVSEFINNENNDIVAERYKSEVENVWNNEYEGSVSWWNLYNTYTFILTHIVKASMIGKMSKYMALSHAFQQMMNGKEVFKNYS